MQAHGLLACSQVHTQLTTFLPHPRTTCLGWQCPQRAGPPMWIVSQENAPAPDMSTGQSAGLSLPHLFQPKFPLLGVLSRYLKGFMERSFRKTALLTLKGWPWSISMDFADFSRKGRYFLLETQEERQSFHCNRRVTPFSMHGTRYLHWACTSYLTTQNHFLVPNAVRYVKPLFSVVQSKKRQWTSCMDKQGSSFTNSGRVTQTSWPSLSRYSILSRSTLYLKAEASRGVLKECPFVTDDSFASRSTTPHTQSHFENVSQGKYDALVSVTISTMTMLSWYKEQKRKGSKGVSSCRNRLPLERQPEHSSGSSWHSSQPLSGHLLPDFSLLGIL